MKKALITAGIMIALSLPTASFANSHNNTVIKDHYRYKTVETPHTKRVCRESEGVAEGAIGGAIVGFLAGSILGGGDVSTRNAGAAFGAIVGAGESKTNTTCAMETTYTHAEVKTYSHSTVSFSHKGKRHTMRFYK